MLGWLVRYDRMTRSSARMTREKREDGFEYRADTSETREDGFKPSMSHSKVSREPPLTLALSPEGRGDLMMIQALRFARSRTHTPVTPPAGFPIRWRC
jgi:hypothetical protein